MTIHRNKAVGPLCTSLSALLLTACASFEGSWAPPQTAQGSSAAQAMPPATDAVAPQGMSPVPQMEPVVYLAPAPSAEPTSMPAPSPTVAPPAPATQVPATQVPATQIPATQAQATPAPAPSVSAKPAPRNFAGVRLMATADSPLTGLDAAAELQWQISIPDGLATQWLPASVRISVLAPDFNLPTASSTCLALPAEGLARRVSLQPLSMGEFQVGLRARLHDAENCESPASATLDEATVVVVESGPNVDPADAQPPVEGAAQSGDDDGSSLPWGLLIVAVFGVALLLLFRGRLQQWVRS